MKKIDLGQTISILANFGVIGGILLLAYELGQNNDFMAAQARYNRLSVTAENWTLLAQDSELAELRLKEENDEQMSALELARWEAYAMRVLVTREWTFRELPRSELPVEMWRRNTQDWKTFRSIYEREKFRFDPEFIAWHEENISGE